MLSFARSFNRRTEDSKGLGNSNSSSNSQQRRRAVRAAVTVWAALPCRCSSWITVRLTKTRDHPSSQPLPTRTTRFGYHQRTQTRRVRKRLHRDDWRLPDQLLLSPTCTEEEEEVVVVVVVVGPLAPWCCRWRCCGLAQTRPSVRYPPNKN